MAAPWLGIVRLHAAVERTLAAPKWLLFLSLALCGVVLWVTSCLTTLWSQTEYVDTVYQRGKTGAAWSGTAYVLKSRSLSEVWAERELPLFGALALVSPLFGTLVTIVVAWLQIPASHPFDSKTEAHRQALRGVCATGGMGVVLLTTVVIGFAASGRVYNRWLVANPGVQWGELGWIGPTLAHAWLPALVFGVIWIRRAVRLACPMVLSPVCDTSPRCDWCGYDLRHRPIDGLCPECAFSVDESLNAERARPGVEWEQNPSLATWFEASLGVLFDSRRFFRRLRLRTSDDLSWGFAVCHLAALALAGGLVAIGWSRMSAFGWPQLTPDARVFWQGVWITWLAAWLFQRLLSIGMQAYEAVRGYIRDYRWMRKIVDYHVVYLWPIGIGNVIAFAVIELWFGFLG